LRIALVLGLSFLIGLEREEHKAQSTSSAFGGVRTFPLIGLLGYGLALLTGGQPIAMAIGLAVLGGFLLLAYRNKVSSGSLGMTSEISALVTCLIGALAEVERIWIATALTVATLLLLELKNVLEGLAKRISADDIISVAKFLLLAVVILPIVPNQAFTRFAINPFRTWLVVVAVSGVSYGGYLLQRLMTGRGSTVLTAIVGGAYSSTVTTIALSRRAAGAGRPRLYAGSILTASGVMYFRIAILIGFFNHSLFVSLSASLAALGTIAIFAGWLWSRRSDGEVAPQQEGVTAANPLELSAAFLFAGIFVVTMIVTQCVMAHGSGVGLFGVAAVAGIVDVDPFVLGMTQSPVAVHSAALGVVVAASSNNLAKGVYAVALADRRTGLRALIGLSALAALGLLPCIWLAR
jgi:uncharacterized membrane protein (DUF4010 family)